jgi:succinylarginine dihydrolase
MTGAIEANFDGLVGPTHNYAGLAYGNVASMTHQSRASSPRQAALQGLAKMKLVADLGVAQFVIPPQERPDVETLRRCGFGGSDHQVLSQAAQAAPALLATCSSASSMWAANLATISPSADTIDGRLHLTPANLVTTSHRALESAAAQEILFALFPQPSLFAHHPPLPHTPLLADEGAANWTRFCRRHGEPGVELFTYGRSFSSESLPRQYPARQSREASEAIARLHRLRPDETLFVQQNPEAIDMGVFHNDVIATGNLLLFLFHERAFVDQANFLNALQDKVVKRCEEPLTLLEVKEEEIPLEEAVSTYLFNSQLLLLPNDQMIMLAPIECSESDRVRRYLEDLVESGRGIQEVHFCDLRQSMNNGGGPACLRLRAVLTEEELQAVHPACRLDGMLYEQLVGWIEEHYRDRLLTSDLEDPALLDESRQALDQLSEILDLGPIYSFQR